MVNLFRQAYSQTYLKHLDMVSVGSKETFVGIAATFFADKRAVASHNLYKYAFIGSPDIRFIIKILVRPG